MIGRRQVVCPGAPPATSTPDSNSQVPSRRHAEPSDRVRTAVFSAAKKLVEEGGFFGLTVEALVQRSGISKATIYRWWANRTAVALDMLTFAYGAPTPVSAEGSAVERIRAFVHAEASYLQGPAGPVIASLIAESQREPHRTAVENAYLGPRRQQLLELFAAAADGGGTLPPGTDTILLTDVLESALYMRLLFQHGPLNRDWLDRVLDLLLPPRPVGKSSEKSGDAGTAIA